MRFVAWMLSGLAVVLTAGSAGAPPATRQVPTPCSVPPGRRDVRSA
jgi:hypothetical protein